MTTTTCDDQLNRECRVCGVAFRRPASAGIPDGYCASCWKASLAFLKLQDDLGDAFSVRLWDEGEERIERIAQSDASGAHYPDPQLLKQVRYRDSEDEDWIDEFARTSTPEEFRGAMRFTVGKYVRRVGRKDAELSEVRKMRDYCQRWEDYLVQLEGEA